MYSLCKTEIPPSTIEHSIYCHFYNLKQQNLVLAGANRLNIYRIIRFFDETQTAKIKLECIQTFELLGTIASIQKIKLGNHTAIKRDSLVIAFHDAKLSVVEYDPSIHDLKTLSMHYFEEESLRDGYVTNHMYPPIVRVDPENRCAAMLIYGKHIVIITLSTDVSEDLDAYDRTANVNNYLDESVLCSSVNHNFPRQNSQLDLQISHPNSNQGIPVLRSYLLELTEEKCGEKISNIVDIEFLHNYNNPTLAVLYEPVRTWSGRIATRKDTFSMVALSLNTHQQLHPIIWTVDALPFDCQKILAVPKPVGGLLIIAVNELIYLNQSVPRYGVSFNTLTATNFPLNEQNNSHSNGYLNISLDLSESVFLSSNKVISVLKDGDIYLVTLFNDDMRCITGFDFEHIGSTVNPSTLTICENAMFFVGSHVGDSQLLEYVDNESLADNSEASPMDDDSPKSFVHLHDKIMSWSSSSQACYGEAPTIHENLVRDSFPFIELVTSTGFEKNGSVCVFQRTIKPNIRDTFKLKDCDDIWTLRPSYLFISLKDSTRIFLTEEDFKEIPQDECQFKTDTKTIYACNIGKDDLAVQVTAFKVLLYKDANLIQTIDVENEICDVAICDPVMVAVAKNGTICYLEMEEDPLSHTDKRYSLTFREFKLLDNTKIVTFSLYKDLSGLFKTEIEEEEFLPEPKVKSNKPVKINVAKRTTKQPKVELPPKIPPIKLELNIDVDDDEDLYGDSSVDAKPIVNSDSNGNQNGNDSIDNVDEVIDYGDDELDDENSQNGVEDSDEDSLYQPKKKFCAQRKPTFEERLKDIEKYNMFFELRKHEPSYWLFLVDDKGTMEIYSLPEFKLVFFSKNIPGSPKILMDSLHFFRTDLERDPRFPEVRELLTVGLGHKGHKPTLFVRFDKELLIYEAYKYDDLQIENHLKLRFKKINTILLTTIPIDLPLINDSKDLSTLLPVENAPVASSQTKNSSRSSKHQTRKGKKGVTTLLKKDNFNEHKHWLKPLGDIDEYSAVFLIGHRPHWFMMTHQGTLRTHPMQVEGSIYSFAKYQNSNFIYFTENREMRIACLASKMNYDSPWPTKKINVGGTAHFVNYHVERKIYSIVTSHPVPCTKYMKVGSEPDTMVTEVIERGDGYISPMVEKFQLRLYDPENWELVPDCNIEFDEWEQVTCVRNVMLESEGTSSGLKGYIAISTNYCYGEDVPNRGRIWILDLIDVVPEPGKPLTKNKIKKVYCDEQKGPLSTLSHTCGLLLSAVGQKIYLNQLKDEQLNGIAFIDTQIYIHAAVSIKNLILVSDIYKSISLLRYQQCTKTLSMVCRDTRPLEVYACEFAIDNELLNFVVTDSEKNIIIYSLNPEHRDSHGGTRMLRHADFHLGAHVNSMCRIKSRVPAAYVDDPIESTAYRFRQITMYLTVDGGFGNLLPINEIVYRRLLMLQNEMAASMPHIAGLNPRAWRCVKHFRKTLLHPSKLILDGDFIQIFLKLSHTERADITRKIGTTVDKILADLQHIYESSLYF